jgi:hypothetical protein
MKGMGSVLIDFSEAASLSQTYAQTPAGNCKFYENARLWAHTAHRAPINACVCAKRGKR